MFRAVFVLIALAVLLLLLARFRQQRGRDPLRRLVQMCGGDEAHARRLIQGELGRNPGLSERQAARRAIVSWKRDLR